MLSQQIKNKIVQYRRLHLLRKRTPLEERIENIITINDTQLINFSSNDYLSLATDSRIKQAFIKGIEHYGFGSTASTLISGYYTTHQVLEEKFAEFLNRDKALLFNSGYHANLGVISALADRHTTIFSDKLCHASLIDAITLSKAKHIRYQHNNIKHLATRLSHVATKNRMIVTDSVFSMEGDIANLVGIAQCAQAAKATLLVDDAHGFGVLGKHGAGVCETHALSQQQIPLLITPLGKACGGLGAIVSGSKELIEALVQFARTYIYTTALPPAIVCALLTTLDIIKNESWRREKLINLIQFFIKAAHQRNLTLHTTDETPIKTIVIGANKKAVASFLTQHACAFL
jgi:8-amino-7-oxononanoate synthase